MRARIANLGLRAHTIAFGLMERDRRVLMIEGTSGAEAGHSRVGTDACFVEIDLDETL